MTEGFKFRESESIGKKIATFAADTAKTAVAKTFEGIESYGFEVSYESVRGHIHALGSSGKDWPIREQKRRVAFINRALHLLREGFKTPEELPQSFSALLTIEKFRKEAPAEIQRSINHAAVAELLTASIAYVEQALTVPQSSTELYRPLRDLLQLSPTPDVYEKVKNVIRKNSAKLEDSFVSLMDEDKYAVGELIAECADDEVAEKFIGTVREKLSGAEYPDLFPSAEILTRLYFSDLSNAQKNGKKEIEKFFQEKGVNPDSLLKAWKETGVKNEFFEKAAFRNNLHQMAEFDKERPGGPKLLWENYGVAAFSRYPLELLNQQYDLHDNNDLPYGVIFSARHDWNYSSFVGDHQIYKHLLDQCQGRYALRVAEFGSKPQLARRLGKLDQKFGDQHKIQFAIFSGHANERLIVFGPEGSEYELRLEELKDPRMKNYPSYLAPDATIIIVACKAGVPGGIGQEMSKEFGWHVIAPDANCNLQNIEVDWQEDKPDFKVEYRKAKDLTYRSGSLSESQDGKYYEQLTYEG